MTDLKRFLVVMTGGLCLLPVFLYEISNFSGGEALSDHPYWALMGIPAMLLFGWAARAKKPESEEEN